MHETPGPTVEATLPALENLPDRDQRMRLGWRILLTILLLLLVGLLGFLARPANAAPAAQSSGDPLVLASYYTWFDENTWSYDQLSDLPAQLYISRDRAVMGRHIDQAKQAGIDGFIVAWYGPVGQFNQTEPNLQALLDEAAARDFKIGILFETDSPFFAGVGDVTNALAHANGTHVNHPAYLRVDGRPVIFFWRPTIYGVDTWRAVRNQVDPGNGNIWISEGVDINYLSVFDGHHLYSNTWNPPTDLNYTNGKFANLVDQMRGQTGAYKFWVATVMPGYNDVRVRPGSGFARDREGGNYFVQSWQAAIASNPNWIIITSFNEWPEGTYIEPSAAFGRQFLDIAAGWSQQFKAGGGQAIDPALLNAAAAPVAVEAAAVAPLPEPEEPTAYVEAPLLNLRAGPGTEFEIVGQANAGTALPIDGRYSQGDEWWRVDTGDTQGWVYGPLVRAAGPLDAVAAIAFEPQPPANEATRTDEADEAADVAARVSAGSITPLAAPDQGRIHPFLAPHP